MTCAKINLATCSFYHHLSVWSPNGQEYSKDNWHSFYSHIMLRKWSYIALLEWYNKISTLSLQGNMTMCNSNTYINNRTASVPTSRSSLTNQYSTTITYKTNNESSHRSLCPLRRRLLCTYAKCTIREWMDIIQTCSWKTIQFNRRRNHSVC